MDGRTPEDIRTPANRRWSNGKRFFLSFLFLSLSPFRLRVSPRRPMESENDKEDTKKGRDSSPVAAVI